MPLVDFKFVEIRCSDVDGVGRNIFISRNNGNMISWDLISYINKQTGYTIGTDYSLPTL